MPFSRPLRRCRVRGFFFSGFASTPQSLPDGGDDAVLVFFAQIGIERKAEDFAGRGLGFGEVSVFVTERSKDRLLVEALRVVNGGGDSERFELLGEGVAVWHADCVLGVNMGVPVTDDGSRADIAEFFGVAGANAIAGLDLSSKARPLGEHDGSLQRVETAVHSNEVVVVAADATVRADGFHFHGKIVVICKQRTTLAVASERLGGVEARAGDLSDIAAFHSVSRGAETLRGIFDDGEAMLRCDGIDGIVVRHLAEEAHGQKRFRGRCDGCLDLLDSDIEIQGINVHEHRLCADLRNHLRRADPGEGNRDDFIARPDLQRAQGYFQTIRAAGHRDGVTTAHIIGEGVFQRLDLGSHNEAPVLKNTVDRFVDGGLEFEILGLEIDEIHGSVYHQSRVEQIHQ